MGKSSLGMSRLRHLVGARSDAYIRTDWRQNNEPILEVGRAGGLAHFIVVEGAR
jgi:hypothetical protein